jgi:hypothetical protein
MGSSLLMVRIIVLLPEPDGPMDHHDVALTHREVDTAEHVKRAEVLVDIAELDHERQI